MKSDSSKTPPIPSPTSSASAPLPRSEPNFASSPPPAPPASDHMSWALGAVALVASIGLSISYFSYGTSFQDIRKQWSMFYSALKPGWVRLSESEIDYAFNNNPDLWTTLAVRAAYGRWRLRPLAPEPFDNIMRDYGAGWWLSPSRETWERKFADYDAKWIAARAGSNDNASPSPPPRVVFERPSENLLVLRFPDRPFTWQVGSLIRLHVDAPADALPDAPIKVYWETEKAPGWAAQRRRLATWRLLDSPSRNNPRDSEDEPENAPSSSDDTTSETQRLLVELDLSWEPPWIYSGAIPRGLHFRSTNAASWEIIRTEFTNSPLFPPGSR